jgi:hypothetical protein
VRTSSGVRGVLRIAVVLALAAAPSAALAASNSSGRVWAINCTREQYKPKRIVISCGDGSTWVGSLKWTKWGRKTATATGNYNVINCTPDCAAGKDHSYAVTIRLSKPKTCPGHTHAAFKQLAIDYTSGTRPTGAPVKVSERCPATLPGEY